MSLQRIVDDVPTRYAGPGGAIAVLREGEVLVRHCWGWADAEARVAFTPATPFLVCSVTKEFTCALLLDRFADPSLLDEAVRLALPDLACAPPGVVDLCHNQSGLRDYWAEAMLCGAPVEGRFDDNDARRLIGRTRTLQFAPGTRYSYCNQNFRILSDVMERRLDRPFDELLRSHVLEPVGMANAALNPETGAVRGGTVGYEGTPETGFRPAVNRIRWTGDAGLAASLDDMIAWERAVDRAHPFYTRLTGPVSFRNGAEAAYGFGLNRGRLLGHPAFSHGGGLRGWRSFRAYLPAPRVSVVVMFNHMADARAAALELLGAVVTPVEQQAPAADVPAGRYRDAETGLAVRVEDAAGGRILSFATVPDRLVAGSTVGLRLVDGQPWMDRPGENHSAALEAVEEGSSDIEGVFHCGELGADLTCVMSGGVTYGAFSGFLGIGAMVPLAPFGRDLWLLPCPRALDYGAPGDWTLALTRDAKGRVEGVQVGCWLARGLMFIRAHQ